MFARHGFAVIDNATLSTELASAAFKSLQCPVVVCRRVSPRQLVRTSRGDCPDERVALCRLVAPFSYHGVIIV